MKLRITAVIGVVLGVVGLVALAFPALTARLPANDVLVTALGALLAIGGLREVRRRHRTELGYATTPDAEEAVELPTPGDEFDRRLDELSGLLYRARERQRIREEVVEVAVATLQRRYEYTAAEAKTALREGTWTDDPFAAAFFTGRSPPTGRLTRVRELLGAGTAFQHRARRAVDELHRLAEEGDDD